MAEMEVADKGGSKKGRKQLSTRVDLTPMVDLGFLLITFFMFTTTLSKPKKLPYNTPFKDENLKEEDKNKIKESTVITCLLSKNGRVYTYRGVGSEADMANLRVLTLEGGGDGTVRKEFQDFVASVNQKKQQGLLKADDDPMALIKPDTNCTFNDLVEVLDEVLINGIPSQATVPITRIEREYISKTEAANGE